MKTQNIYRNFLFSALFLVTASVNAQNIPQGKQQVSNASAPSPTSIEGGVVTNALNYQAVARNSSGTILASQTVGIRISIENGSGGTVLYSERHVPTTNQFGLFTLKIGSGTPLTGTYNSIVWGNGNQWMKVDMDPSGGTSYTTMGESELLSVPFSNFSLASGDNHWTAAGNDIHNSNSGNVGIGTTTPLKRLHAEEQTLTGVTNDFSSFSFYGNNGNYNNVIIAEGNDNGTSSPSTDRYSRGMIAGGQDVPSGGFKNYGVWGHVYGTGADGWGGIFTHGAVTSTSSLYVQLAGQRAGVFHGGNVAIMDDPSTASTPADFHLSIDAGAATTYLPGLSLFSSSAPGTDYGVALFGVSYAQAGGLNVGDGMGVGYGPVQASAFNVSSDRRMKKNITDITSSDYSKYMTQIRNIESSTFFYKWETADSRPYAHIGVIAQTLPVELQAHISESPSKKGEERLGVSLADLSGLLLVGVKALDEKQTKYESEIAALKAQVEELKNQISQMKK